MLEPPPKGQNPTSAPLGAIARSPADTVLQRSTINQQRPSIPDHELLGPIASGAYGEVWLACNVIGTLRAVKIVRRERHASADSFDREFKGLQKFEPISRAHEGLVDILTLGLLPDGAGFYYVMELADSSSNQCSVNQYSVNPTPPTSHTASGPLTSDSLITDYSPLTLRADLRTRGALPADEVVTLGLKLTAAIAHLHAQGLVHRDIKPSNILFVGGVPKLADAGLVAALDDARSLVGTAGYIAPEGPGSPQADLYALGKVLYETAFGKDRQDFPQLPPDLRSRPDHARLLELNTVLLRACATNPRDRYASTEEMHADLTRLVEGKSVSSQHLWQQRAQLGKRLALLGALVALLAAMFVVTNNELIRRNHANKSTGETFENSGTTNRAAWFAYERACQIGKNFTHSAHSNALVNYELAIALDPNFARARAVLALQLMCVDYGGMSAKVALTRTREAAEMALRQDPKVSAAWQALALAKAAEYDVKGAETIFRKTLSMNLNDSSAHINYGVCLGFWGRFAEAEQHLRASIQLEPSWPGSYIALAKVCFYAERYEDAIREVERGIELEPNREMGYWVRGDILWEKSERERAARDWLRATQLSALFDAKLPKMERALKESGPSAFIREQIVNLAEYEAAGGHGQAFNLAVAYARLDNCDEALLWLELSVDEHLIRNSSARVNPAFRQLQNDSRFQAVLSRLGYTDTAGH